MISSNRRFLLYCVAFFLLIVTAYFLVVDRILVPRHLVHKSYRHFMLEASQSVPNRIIIESGSNSAYGIDTDILAQETRRASFIIADNGGYPLLHKIYRLRQFLNPGDLVILPIEWNQYGSGQELHQAYTESLIKGEAPNAFYYHSLPLWRRMQFVFYDLPYHLVGEVLDARRLNVSPDLKKQQHYLNLLKNSIDAGSRGSKQIEEDIPLLPALVGMHCNTYLFGHYGKYLQITDRFRDNLSLLAKVQQVTGARMMFAWPTVASNSAVPCYAGLDDKLSAHVSAIKALIEAKGFTILGEIQESRFDGDCLLNTFYHVKRHCGAQRTRLLVEQLREAGITGQSEMSSEEVTLVLQGIWQELYDQVRSARHSQSGGSS